MPANEAKKPQKKEKTGLAAAYENDGVLQKEETNLDAFKRETELPPKTIAQKYEGFQQFWGSLNQSQNNRVAKIFFMVSAVMFILPLIVLFVVMHGACPALGFEKDCDVMGAMAAVGTVVLVMMCYTAWAMMWDDVPDGSEQKNAAKKRQ